MDAPEILSKLISLAEDRGASDLHLHMVNGVAQVAYRLDGLLTPFQVIPGDVGERILGRVKFLANLKTYQQSMPQDGRISGPFVSSRSDIRVATYPTVTGEKIVLRFFSEFKILELDELGFDQEVVALVKAFLDETTGLLLLTGPAGSGKTTTIYACLQYLVGRGGLHIITVEDPVERVVPGIMQTEVSDARGLNFAKASKHLLRQDPQVLVIGEIRDEETANIAVRAAFTGHLVISTFHAGSCKGVFERLFTMCEDRFSAVSAVGMTLNQRLLRRLCKGCSGSGCPQCLHTGYHGRVPVVEWVCVDDALREKIRTEGPSAVAPSYCLKKTAKTLVKNNITGESEYRRVFGHEIR